MDIEKLHGFINLIFYLTAEKSCIYYRVVGYTIIQRKPL